MTSVNPVDFAAGNVLPDAGDGANKPLNSRSPSGLSHAKVDDDLRETEARYRALFEAIDEGFCIIEQIQPEPGGASDFRYVEANPAFKRQSGIEDVVGKTVRQVLPGECDEWIATYDSVIESGQALRFERGLIALGRVLELHAFPVGESRHLRLGVSFRDVTERKKSEDLLRRNRDSFFNLVENAPFGLYVVDAQFRVCQVSKAAKQVFGRVVPLLGRDFEDVLRCVWADPFVSDAMARFRHTLATGEPYAAPNTTQARRDLPELESYDWKIQRITLPDGQFGVACYFYDITERVQAQATLRHSEQRFRALFDRGPVAIYSVDATGAIQEFNAVAAQFWGQQPDREGASGHLCGAYGLYWPDGTPLPHEETPIVKVLNGELPEARDVEMVIERPDGSRSTVIANIAPLRDGDGVITGAINCFYDITERKRLETETRQQAAALKDQDRRKDEFLAMLAHELRNPLAPISAAAEILSLQHLDSSDLHETSQVIRRQVRHMTGLVDDLLDVSRVTRGLVQIEETPQELKDVIASAVEQVRPLLQARTQRLTMDLTSQHSLVRGDGKRLVQVLANLLNNASKYTPLHGHIHIGLDVNEHEARLCVQDNGIGIPTELHARVFELFTQAERTPDRSQGGLGLGLALVKSLVELHGGTVTCTSDGPRHGSTFMVTLPRLHNVEDAPGGTPQLNARPAATSGANPGSGRKLNVLVVDDNVDAADMLKRMLQTTGNEIFVEHDPLRALARATREAPDVYLLDIGLPGMDGFELVSRLRALPAGDRATYIAVTGYGQEQNRASALAAGFDRYLVKPVELSTLLGVLSGLP